MTYGRADGDIVEMQPFPSPSQNVHVYKVTYMSEGLRVKGFLAEPVKRGNYPGFLYLRGGIGQVGMVRLSRIVQFASLGFIVMAPFYRGNLGGEGQEDFAGADRADAISAFYVLRKHPRVYADQIHAYGFSRGGIMALLTAAYVRDLCSVVTWGGVSNMFLTYEERIDLRRMMKRVCGGTPNKAPEQYEWRSAYKYIHDIHCPVLIIHGAMDAHVGVEHAHELEKLLKKANKRVESWIYEEYDHYFPPHINRQLVARLTNWMKTNGIAGGAPLITS